MGLFQPELGIPGGHGEWLIGDEEQVTLAKYNRGFVQITENDDYLYQVLGAITNPNSVTQFRTENSHDGKEYLALYTVIGKEDRRRDDMPTMTQRAILEEDRYIDV